MTDDMMNLPALLEKTPDADLWREMIGFAAPTANGVRGRGAYRGNIRREEPGSSGSAQWLPPWDLGDSRRQRRTAQPQAAQGPYFPGFLEPRRMAEKALARWCRRLTYGPCRPGRLTTWCKPRASVASPKARYLGCAPRSAIARRGLALPLGRRHLREGASEWAHHVRRGRRQQGRPA
jgi:hypothetical protein